MLINSPSTLTQEAAFFHEKPAARRIIRPGNPEKLAIFHRNVYSYNVF